MINSNSTISVIAPHPDDETIALGGTIARFSNYGCKVRILVVSGHLPPLYPEESYARTVEEAKIAFKLLGVDEFQFGAIPATFVHQRPVSELNKSGASESTPNSFKSFAISSSILLSLISV